MDGKREEVLPFLDRLGSGDRGQDHRFAERRDNRAVGLTGNLARFESQRFTAPLDRYFFHVKHVVSFARRALCRAGPLCPGNQARGGVGRLSAPMAVPPDAGAALWSGTLRGANMTAAPEIRGDRRSVVEGKSVSGRVG